ncbi:MAG: lysophospholipid acyltransferase family protein [Chthoniobacterales bacterium]
MKIEGWRARWLIAFGHRLLQIWARTLRFEIEDRANVVGTPPNERYIGALWHNRLLLLPFVIKRYLPERRGAALISGSRDGALLADLVERFQFHVVRGSSSKKGASAIRQLAEVIASGKDVVITPDGPRGPAYELGQGIIFLAQQSGAEVVPINLEYSSCWRVKSWDRFILPRPFSIVRVIFGAPHRVAPTSTDEEFERERQRLQDAMMQLVEMR